MAYCKYCGKEIDENLKECPYCKRSFSKKKSNSSKKYIWIVVALLVVGIYLYSNSGKCKATGCNEEAMDGSDYCYYHTYVYSSSEEKKEAKVSSYQLKLYDIELENNSLYTKATGSILNNSDYTVKFVKIKGSFVDKNGNTIDTDWTYAVGSEGLEPGESCKWTMSVDKDYYIKDCNVTIDDYDVD